MRFARQEAIPGWHQDQLAHGRVVIVGTDRLAAMLAVSLAAQGVGLMALVATGASQPWLRALASPRATGPSWVRDSAGPHHRKNQLAAFLRRVHPEGLVTEVRMPLHRDAVAALVPAAEVLVSAGDDRRQHALVRELGARRGTRVIVVSALGTAAWCRLFEPGESLTAAAGDEAIRGGSCVAGLLGAALAGDMVRRVLLPLPDDEPQHGWVTCDTGPPPGVSVVAAPAASGRQGGRVLVVGAGGLGTWVALALALRGGVALTIVDPDVVTDTNLNRQVLFYDGVGRHKAPLLAERLANLTGADVIGEVGRVEDVGVADDVRVVCAAVDTFRARAWLSRACGAQGIPLVSGGTSAFAGTVHTYVPGRTPCLECALGVSRLAADETDIDSCGRAPDPSHVVPNQAIGALMAAEVLRVRAGGPEVEPRGSVELDLRQPARLGVHRLHPPCACHREEQTS